MSCKDVGRDFFMGTAREQLIAELELALKKAKDPNVKLVRFNIIDYEIEYFFDKNDRDIEKVYQKSLNPRHFLLRLDNQNYFIEPKSSCFWISRYNDVAGHLERLTPSEIWIHASWYGKPFYSADEFILYCRENLAFEINEVLMEERINEIFGYSSLDRL